MKMGSTKYTIEDVLSGIRNNLRSSIRDVISVCETYDINFDELVEEVKEWKMNDRNDL